MLGQVITVIGLAAVPYVAANAQSSWLDQEAHRPYQRQPGSGRTSPSGYTPWSLRRQAVRSCRQPTKTFLYQQNLKGRKIAFVVLGNQQWPTLRRYIERVVAAVEASTQGSYTEADIPFT
jgi:hypothetical protein